MNLRIPVQPGTSIIANSTEIMTISREHACGLENKYRFLQQTSTLGQTASSGQDQCHISRWKLRMLFFEKHMSSAVGRDDT